MSQEEPRNPLAQKEIVYQPPGAEAVTVRRDVEYRASGDGLLTMDVYAPPSQDGPLPAVVLVAGYPDPGFQKFLGCRFKEMGSSVSWARAIAASGLAAVTYANREPAADLHALLQDLRRNAAALGVDGDRMGLWASSGNVPLALSALMQEGEFLRCAALCYGYTLDLDGSTRVAEAAGTWRFANPAAGRSIEDLPEIPLFVARAGGDQTPSLNESLDLFVAGALRRDLPLTLVNHPKAPHAFDLLDDGETTREIIRGVLAFLRFHLCA